MENNEKRKDAAIDLVSYFIAYLIGFLLIDYAMDWVVPGSQSESSGRLLRVVIPIIFIATLSGTIRDLIDPPK